MRSARWATGCLIVAAVLVIFQPWIALPFEAQDFSTMLPLLRASDSFGGRFDALSSYYHGHGRFFPLSGAVVYLPWPYHQPYHAAPFLVGTALLLALAITATERDATPLVRRLTRGALAALALFGVLRPREEHDNYLAQRRANASLVAALDERVAADPRASVAAFSPRGETCVRCYLALDYTRALGVAPFRFTRLSACDAIARLAAGTGSLVVIARLPSCPSLGPPAETILRPEHHYFSARPAGPVGADRTGVWVLSER